MYKISLRKRGSTWEYRFQIHSTNGKQQYASKSVWMSVVSWGYWQASSSGEYPRKWYIYTAPCITTHKQGIHKELNMPLFDFHTLRHTHTTLLLEAGANPLDVQERLGHSRLAITWQYAHNTDVIRQQTHQILSTIYK